MPGALVPMVLLVLGLTPRQWLEVVSALGFGVLSSIIPIFHTEVFIVPAVASRLIDPLLLSIGLAVGHVIGKQIMFLGVRHGKQLKIFKKKDGEAKEPEPGTWRARWRTWSTKTALLVEQPKWGYPIVFISSASGIPPVYATVLFAGTTKMNFWGFSLTMLVGFFIRCYLLALITLGAFSTWF